MNNNSASLAEYRRKLRSKRIMLGVCLCILLAAAAVWRIAQGEWNIPLARVAELLSPSLPESERTAPEAIVVRLVRLPRFLAAVGTGGLLAVSGAVLQGVLVNPLAEPYTLGIAAGAAFGGALGFFFGSLAVMPMAFMGALAALWLVNMIAWKGGGGSSAYIVLAGIVTNAILSAGVTFLKAIADDKLGAIVLWLMGSLAGAAPLSAAMVWVGSAIVLVPAFILGRQLDAVSLGEGRGEALGVDERKLRLVLLCSSSIASALAVSYFGIIGFVGLVTPHILRLLIGPSHRQLLAFSFLAGGTLLAVADGAAQWLGELPVGVVTALVGGPFFCWILVSGRRTAK